MDDRTAHAAVAAMARFGGSFVRSLAAAYRAADSDNRARLVGAFPELFERYAEMARQMQREIAP